MWHFPCNESGPLVSIVRTAEYPLLLLFSSSSPPLLLLPLLLPLPCSLGDKYKREGNEAYKSGEYLRAKDLYSSAIEHDPQNATYYGNRSATHMMLLDYSAALDDSTRSVQLDESYTKVRVVMPSLLPVGLAVLEIPCLSAQHKA